jgi:hypothetical protein
MRPSALDPLFAPASALQGIGPKNAKLIDRLPGARWITGSAGGRSEVDPTKIRQPGAAARQAA